jgi:hypothetical protein
MTTKIDEIEKQAKNAGLGALYLTTMRAIYAIACLKNKESGNKQSDLACVEETFNRIERAWALEERMPVSRASVDILLVQILKDEIAISQVAKIVEK